MTVTPEEWLIRIYLYVLKLNYLYLCKLYLVTGWFLIIEGKIIIASQVI